MASTLLTARSVITGALETIGVLQPGENPSASEASDGLRRLNGLMGSWVTQSLTIPVIRREVFDLTANKGGPDNPYTIGVGGDLNTTRPTTIVGVGLLLTTSSPPVEVPRAILTDDAWEALRVKSLTSAQFTSLYYNPTFTTSGLGTINLWPVPDNATNDLVLYRPDQIAEFADLSTEYQFPPGYQEALEYNLAIRLFGPYGRPVMGDVVSLAREALGNIKRTNTKLTDLPLDPMWVQNSDVRRGFYNIFSGNL